MKTVKPKSPRVKKTESRVALPTGHFTYVRNSRLCVIDTAHGPAQCVPGDVIVTGVGDGEQSRMTEAEFQATFDVFDQTTATKKSYQ